MFAKVCALMVVLVIVGVAYAAPTPDNVDNGPAPKAAVLVTKPGLVYDESSLVYPMGHPLYSSRFYSGISAFDPYYEYYNNYYNNYYNGHYPRTSYKYVY